MIYHISIKLYILWEKELTSIQRASDSFWLSMKGFQGEMIVKQWTKIDIFWKIYVHWDSFNQAWYKASLDKLLNFYYEIFCYECQTFFKNIFVVPKIKHVYRLPTSHSICLDPRSPFRFVYHLLGHLTITWLSLLWNSWSLIVWMYKTCNIRLFSV